jgi:hypothetical protein
MDQDLTVQETALKAAGANIVLSEKITGTTSLDRLGRSILDLANIVEQLKARKIRVRCTEQAGIEVGTPAGDAFVGMLSVFAQFEAAIRRERQLEGIAKAKAKVVTKVVRLPLMRTACVPCMLRNTRLRRSRPNSASTVPACIVNCARDIFPVLKRAGLPAVPTPSQ